MTRHEEARFDALQAALEAEERRLADALFYVRRSLAHLQATRHELRTGKPLHAWAAALRGEEPSA